MQSAIRRLATVETGGNVRICSRELPVGAEVEVTILFDASQIDTSDCWSEEDMRDFSKHSLLRFAESMGEENK